MSAHVPDPVEAVGHERRDVNVRATAIFLTILQVVMLACCVLGVVFHRAYLHWMKISAVSISPIALYIMEAPEPRLQVDSTADYDKFKETQDKLVHSYSWIDEQAGTVRLPIERAKELLLERGVPSRGRRPS